VGIEFAAGHRLRISRVQASTESCVLILSTVFG